MDLACNYLVKYIQCVGWHEYRSHDGRYWGHTGGTEVCVGGRTGVGVSPPCINYTGKKPARTQKLSVMMAIMKS